MFTKVKTTSKKAFSMLLAFVMCFTAFAVCMPVIADAISMGSYVPGRYYYYPQGTQFISSIRYGHDKKDRDTAKNEAKQDNYTLVDLDFNKGDSSADYIYLGYQTSTDINAAMATYFRNSHDTSAETSQFMVNGKVCDFTITGLNTSGIMDLNKSQSDGDYIYLYATKDPKAGLPVTAITVISSGSNSQTQPPAGYYTVERDNSGSPSDCNKGAGGDYIYIYFDNTSAYTDVTNPMLRMLEAIETAETLGAESCYTANSYRTFKDARNAALRIAELFNNPYNAGTADASQITSAASALENAIAGLETVIRIDAATNGGTTTATQYTVLSGDKKTVSFPGASYTATKEGHTFLGWSTDKDATTGSKKTFSVPVGATVYAIFSINKFTVNFYNTITKETVKSETVNYKGNATAPEVPQFIKNNADTHYKFTGWNKEFTNITAGMTVNTVYETEAHSFRLVSETTATCKRTGVKNYVCDDCGETKTETAPIDPNNHVNTVSYPAKESTCTIPGYTAYTYCNDCQKVISGREELPLAEHKWGEWSTPTATCTKDGITTRKCSVCGATETKPVAATGHTWGDWTTTKEATCTATGREERVCSVCKETESRIKNALGHNYVPEVTAPTCTDIGYTTHTCSRCGDSYIDTYTEALGHDWQDKGAPTKEPTCTETGLQNQKCSRCDETQVKVLDELGHNWTNKTITKNPTCTETGLMNATCDRCGDVQTSIEIPALGHEWNDGVITVAPTCTHPGNKHYTCNVCGEEKNEVLYALGHAWDEGVVIIKPTCSSEGEKYHICANCGDVKTEKIAKLPHEYNGVVTFPTCTEGGYTTYTCSVCGDVLVTEHVDAVGHANLVTVVPPSCTLQGYTVTRCLVCDQIDRTDYVPATGHKYETSTVLPTCTDQGYTLVKCSNCGDSAKKDFVDALGHKYTVSTVAPTCTQKGYDLHTCIRGDRSYKDNYVDATGHNYVEVEGSRVEPTKTQSGYIIHACDVCNNEMKEILYYEGKALVYITLYDTEGNFIPNATVTFTEMNTGTTFELKTDLNGYFTEVLPEGDYELTIKANGIKTTTAYIYVHNGNAEIDIPEIPVVECDCYCHKSDFISAIRRIFAKILAIFGVKHECCEHSAV